MYKYLPGFVGATSGSGFAPNLDTHGNQNNTPGPPHPEPDQKLAGKQTAKPSREAARAPFGIRSATRQCQANPSGLKRQKGNSPHPQSKSLPETHAQQP